MSKIDETVRKYINEVHGNFRLYVSKKDYKKVLNLFDEEMLMFDHEKSVHGGYVFAFTEMRDAQMAEKLLRTNNIRYDS